MRHAIAAAHAHTSRPHSPADAIPVRLRIGAACRLPERAPARKPGRARDARGRFVRGA